MPTALELSREERQKYIEAAKKKRPSRELTLEEERAYERLMDQIRKAGLALKNQLGARRVILFGSLAHKAWFTSDTDVDLAIEGLPGQDYWDAWRIAEDMISDRPVELIDIETASEPLKRAIQRTGIEL